MIRPFQLRDASLVARLQRVGTPLDIEEQLTHPRSPLRSVLLDSVFAPRSGPTTFILDQPDENGPHVGLAQMRSHPGRPEQDVVFMSPSLETGNGSHAIWQRLLTHLCIQTAERGGLRLYARLPIQSEELQLFKNVGFLEYAEEDIYQLDQAVNRNISKPNLQLRPQQASAGWGLQKLYASVAPRTVQNAEGLAQGQWALSHQFWLEQGRRGGYVWEVDGELLGALHIIVGKCGYLIRTLLHPDALDQAEAFAQAALSFTAKKPNLPVYFAFRQYEAGWRNVLPLLGFEPFTSRTMVVKHMTVRVRGKAPVLMPVLEKSSTEGATSIVTRAEAARSQTTKPVSQNGHSRRRSSKFFTLLL